MEIRNSDSDSNVDKNDDKYDDLNDNINININKNEMKKNVENGNLVLMDSVQTVLKFKSVFIFILLAVIMHHTIISGLLKWKKSSL